jgi:hypothetical protein
LLSGVDQLPQSGSRVGDDELEQAVEFAILQGYAGSAEGVEVGEYLSGAGDLALFAGDVRGVGAEVDGDVETIFEQAEILVACAVKGLDAGSDFDCLFDQAGI